MLDAASTGFVYTFGKNQNDYSYGAGVLVLEDGYLTVGGGLLGGGGKTDGTVIKIDALGNLLWYSTYGRDTRDELRFPFESDWGTYHVFGKFGSSPILLELDVDGSFLGSISYGIEGYFTDVVRLSDGYAAVGWLKGAEMPFLMVMDDSGRVRLARYYTVGNFSGVYPDGSGGFVIVGSVGSAGLVLRVDSSGNVVWAKGYDGIHQEYLKDVYVAASSIFVLGSTTSEGAGNWDLWLLVLDLTDGSVNLSRTYGGRNEDHARTLMPSSGKLGVFAYTRSWGAGAEWWLMEVDALGNVITSLTIGGSGDDFPENGAPTPDGGYFLVGYTQTPAFNSGGAYDHMVAKLPADKYVCIESGTPTPEVYDFLPDTYSVSVGVYSLSVPETYPTVVSTMPDIDVKNVCVPFGDGDELGVSERTKCGDLDLQGGNVRIYTVDGRRVTGDLKPGVYVVVAKGQRYKVLIR